MHRSTSLGLILGLSLALPVGIICCIVILVICIKSCSVRSPHNAPRQIVTTRMTSLSRSCSCTLILDNTTSHPQRQHKCTLRHISRHTAAQSLASPSHRHSLTYVSQYLIRLLKSILVLRPSQPNAQPPPYGAPQPWLGNYAAQGQMGKGLCQERTFPRAYIWPLFL
jgi:hypothetical protein